MTVHAITAVAEQPAGVSVSEARSLVEEFIADFDRTLTDEELRLRAVEPQAHADPPTHFRGRYRFALRHDADPLASAVAAALDERPDIDWYRVSHHLCDHDEPPETRGSCDPSVVATHGSVPEGV